MAKIVVFQKFISEKKFFCYNKKIDKKVRIKDKQMLAIVETCGKQYEIQEGRYIDVEFLGKEENETIELDKVVMIVAGDQSLIGQPYLEGAAVKVTVLKNGKEKKILVYKQRCKKGYRRKNGHRQQFSRIMVDSIDFPGKAEVLACLPKTEEA